MLFVSFQEPMEEKALPTHHFHGISIIGQLTKPVDAAIVPPAPVTVEQIESDDKTEGNIIVTVADVHNVFDC